MLKNSFSYIKMKIHSIHFFHSVLLGSIGGKGGGIIRLRELFCFVGALLSKAAGGRFF